MSNWLELSSKGASIAALSVCANIAFAGTPTADEMWEIIQQQQETIESMGSTPATKSATHIGGYGELHINHLGNEKAGGSDKDSADLHRLVLFVSHEFRAFFTFKSISFGPT